MVSRAARNRQVDLPALKYPSREGFGAALLQNKPALTPQREQRFYESR